MVSQMGKVQTIISDWRQRKTNLRCNEVKAGLEHLGFTVRDGRRGGHKIVSHPQLKDFFGTDFNGGSGPNDLVKPRYIEKLTRVLSDWMEELEQI